MSNGNFRRVTTFLAGLVAYGGTAFLLGDAPGIRGDDLVGSSMPLVGAGLLLVAGAISLAPATRSKLT